MGTLYENISVLCAERNIKPGRMCAETGISRGLITDLKMQRKTSITVDTAQKIADYFGVSVDRVLTGEEQKNNPAPNHESEVSDEYADVVRTVEEVRDSDAPITAEEFIAMLKRNNIISEGHDFGEADYRFVESQINMLNSWFKKES